MRFVVDDCNRDPHVQNGHDDKPNENLCISCGDDGGEDPRQACICGQSPGESADLPGVL